VLRNQAPEDAIKGSPLSAQGLPTGQRRHLEMADLHVEAALVVFDAPFCQHEPQGRVGMGLQQLKRRLGTHGLRATTAHEALAAPAPAADAEDHQPPPALALQVIGHRLEGAGHGAEPDPADIEVPDVAAGHQRQPMQATPDVPANPLNTKSSSLS